MYGSPAASKELDLSFPYYRKEDSDLRRHHHQQQHQELNLGLLRYRSAPSSLFGEACGDFLPVKPSNPEADTMLSRFLSPDLREEVRDKPGGGGSPQFPPPQASPATGEPLGTDDNPQMLYHSLQQHQIPSHGSVEGSYRAVVSMAMDTEQLKSGSCPNLIRHSSSPAGLFSHLNLENGYAMMRSMSGLRNGNGSIGEAGMANRLKSQMSLSSRQGSIMSQISEMGSEGMGGSSPEESSLGTNTGGGRCYVPGYPISSWDESAMLTDNFSGLKRARQAGLHPSEPQNGEVRNNVSSLTHQFSLPKTTSEMAALEKFLRFQDAVPCKVRAKRGCATHPRSIAERVRRTRISERMRKLQELVPNMDKQTNTADMLDLAVEYIKDLQRQVKSLSENRASCTCSSSKLKPYAAV